MNDREGKMRKLKQLQSLPLDEKVALTEQRIKDWVGRFGVNGVFVSFSGGKDSTVLLDIARKLFPDIKGVFSDTGLEYPEIRNFVKTFENIEWIKPKLVFKEVIKRHGLPFISKETSEIVRLAKSYVNHVLDKIDEGIITQENVSSLDPFPYSAGHKQFRSLAGLCEYDIPENLQNIEAIRGGV